MDAHLKAIRLVVNDYRASLRFYRDVLGCKPHWGGEDTVIVDFGFAEEPTMLALFDRQSLTGEDGGDRTGAIGGDDRFILVFRVKDLGGLYRDLKGRGVEFLHPPVELPALKIRAVRFRDPDGNLLEINERLEA